MGLFSKKPGGTLFGNLLRLGASKLAPGVLGTGANMIPATGMAVAPVADPMKMNIPPSTVPMQGESMGLFDKIFGPVNVDVGAQTGGMPKWVLPAGLGLAAILLLSGRGSGRR